MYILPTFLRTFLIIFVILKTVMFELEEILKGDFRCSSNISYYRKLTLHEINVNR